MDRFNDSHLHVLRSTYCLKILATHGYSALFYFLIGQLTRLHD